MERSRRLRIAIILNLTLVVAQVVAGLAASSVGLVADAAHNAADTAALALTWGAFRLARRRPDANRSFGWHRSTVLAAQLNAAAILAVCGLIGIVSLSRLAHPGHVHSAVVMVVAAVALLVNAGSALAVGTGHVDLGEAGTGHDHATRSAFLHLAGDAAASAGLLVAAGVETATGGHYWLDPLVAVAIAVLIGWEAARLVSSTTDVLLESTPPGLNAGALSADMAGVAGVEDVHDLHVWSLSAEVRALSAHLVLAGHPTLEEAQAVGGLVRRQLAERWHITHATLELECETCVSDGGEDCSITALTEAPGRR